MEQIDCCYESVFRKTLKRIGRCNYRCDKCGSDVSMIWAFYILSLKENENDTPPLQNRK